MRSRLLIAVLVLGAVVSAVVAIVPQLGGSPEPAATASPATPVFSLRRVPAAITRTVAAQRLRDDLDGVLTVPALAGARDDTCLAVSDPSGRIIYGRQTDRPLIPASTMKLLTGSVALARLGPDFRYVTPAKASAAPQAGAVGDLWLVGSGDPLLATSDYASTAGWLEMPRPNTSIEALADHVVAAGVRRVGRVLGDESRYDTQRYLPSWDPSYAAVPYVGPQSALSVNDGFVRYRPAEVPAAAPALNAATVFAEQLRARDVTVGAVGEGRAPDGAVTVGQVESMALPDVLGAMLQHSHNLGAELLVKVLGARFGGAGTTASGLGVIRGTATDAGLPTGALSTADGSGLDRGDRLSCDLLQAVLTQAKPDGALAHGLPVAGESGTLVRRFLGTDAVGKVRAKTGSLSGVVGLSGYATGRDGAPLTFSLVANDLPSEGAGVGLQDRLATALATYPRAPSPDELAPRSG
ncbi:MAG: D-alanyl-D-alanine carboxypeptidase/D-alanyl-D-alanine endopeptidase [Acidimicrobiales bacterium]